MSNHQLHEQYHLSNLSTSPLSVNDFLDQVQQVRADIRDFASKSQQISCLHQRSVTSADDGSTRRQLDHFVTTTHQLIASIRGQILFLKTDTEKSASNRNADFNVKKTQVESLTADFKREVETLLAEEQRYRSLCREQIARQYRIVNPNATDAEAREAAEMDWAGGVFQGAVCFFRRGMR